MLRTHLIWMRILDPHWEKMDPDPYLFQFFNIFLRKLLYLGKTSIKKDLKKTCLLMFNSSSQFIKNHPPAPLTPAINDTTGGPNFSPNKHFLESFS